MKTITQNFRKRTAILLIAVGLTFSFVVQATELTFTTWTSGSLSASTQYPTNQTDRDLVTKITVVHSSTKLHNNDISAIASTTNFPNLEVVDLSGVQGSSTSFPQAWGTGTTEVATANTSKLKSISLPTNVTSIATNAFANCAYLETVVFPAGLTTLYSYAFCNCSKLVNINLQNTSLNTVNNYVFSKCIALKEVILPNTLAALGANMFRDCSNLETLTLPAVSAITSGNNTNLFNGITSLKKVICKATVVPTTASELFTSGTITNTKLYVPSELVGAYKASLLATTKTWYRFNDSNILPLQSADTTLNALTTTNEYLISNNSVLTISGATSIAGVTVEPGSKVTLNSGASLSATNGITLFSDATGTATFVDTNNDTPQAMTGTMQQYITAQRNWYMGAPITAATNANLNLGTSLQTYNEDAATTRGWSTITSGSLTPGKGYVSVATSATGSAGKISFTGTYNTGTVPVDVTNTGGEKAGFNLVANPYPSYLDWSLVTADTDNSAIGKTMWFRTKTAAGAYVFSTYNSEGEGTAVANSATTTISKFIPPMQAFWIKANSTTQLKFKNNMRAHREASGNTFKAPRQSTQPIVRMVVSNGTHTDETLLYLNENALNAFDNYDSQKMFNNSASQPEIYTLAANEKVVINGLSELTPNLEMPIGFTTGTAGNFTLKTTELSNFDTNTRIVLIDKQDNKELELTSGAEYSFSSNAVSNSESRFSLLFRAPSTTTGVNDSQKLNAQIFVNAANQITIIAPEKSNYSIYNAVGQQIANGIIKTELQTIDCKLQTGIYVVKVNNQSTRVVVK